MMFEHELVNTNKYRQQIKERSMGSVMDSFKDKVNDSRKETELLCENILEDIVIPRASKPTVMKNKVGIEQSLLQTDEVPYDTFKAYLEANGFTVSSSNDETYNLHYSNDPTVYIEWD